MKQIAAALVAAQKSFGPALKTSNNPHFKSKYADLASCIEAVLDALNANGVALIQQCHECDSGVLVETIFLHESGETWSAGKLRVPAAKNDAQGYGSALTYARRYSLMAACGIAPEDDDGNAATRATKAAVEQASMLCIDKQQAKTIHELLESTESDCTAFLAWVSKGVGVEVRCVEDMPQSAYGPAKKLLINKQVKAAIQ